MRRHHANWLHRHAAGDSPGTRLPFVANVLPVILDGRTWSAATDTRMILAVSDGGELLHEQTSSDGYARLHPEMKRFLNLADARWSETTLHDLWSWVAVSHRLVCDYCERQLGHGVSRPCSECDECQGTGYFRQEIQRYGRIGGALVNVEELLSALPPELIDLGSEFCRIGLAPFSDPGAEARRMFLARGERWRMVLIEPPHDEFEPPVGPFPLYLPGVGPLWHARHDPLGRLVLADRYEERGEAEYAAHLREHVPPW